MPPLYDTSILATDFAPDADTLRSTIAPHRDVLQGLESKLAHDQENNLDGLRVQRDNLCSLLKINEGLSAPIRRLAPELIGEIFSHSVAMGNRLGRMIDDLPPLVLLNVCHRWRRVALGTPQLWTAIRFDEDLVESESFESMNSWMVSSGSLPLSIHLHFPYFKSNHCMDGQSLSSKIIQLVAKNLSRCRTLEFDGTWGLQMMSPCERSAKLSSLRSLRIDLSQDSMHPWAGGINAPSLQELSIIRPGQLLTRPISRDTLTSLSTVEISLWHPEPAEAVFLESCPALRKLAVRFSFPAAGGMRSPPLTVHLPSLREMHVAWMSSVDISGFMHAICSPGLEVLGLEQIDRNGSPSSLAAMLSTFPSSPGTLRRLRLNSLPSFPEDVQWLFRKFVNIETLILEDKAAFPMIMETLISPPDVPPREWVCPSLTRLHLIRLDLTSQPCQTHSLIRFAEARSPVGIGGLADGQFLGRISTENCWVRSHDDQAALQALGHGRSGLVIEGLETLAFK